MYFDFAGIQKIKIPISQNEVTIDVVKKYLPEILKKHDQNAQKIKHFRDYTDGVKMGIDYKSRKYNSIDGGNNIIKQNHAYYMVSFKEGFLLGDKREFAQKNDSKSDDLIYFDRYLSDVSFFGKDVEIKHDIYSCGVGISFVYPRLDILKNENNVYSFKDEFDGYDVQNDSPFVYERLDPVYNGVVYTSNVGSIGVGDLFCFNIAFEEDKFDQKKKVITVYTKDFTAKFDYQGKVIGTPNQMPTSYKMLPMVEHSINNSRMGIVEVNETLLDGINTLVSNCVDNVVDVVNQIFVFLGCDADSDVIKKMYEDGGVSIPPANGVQTPDVKTLHVGLDYSDVNVVIQELLTQCYDIVGIPLSAGISGSGNNQAAYIGGGWTNALSVIKRDVLSLEQSDRELLKRMIAICKLNPNTMIREITANQIEIKYNVKITDNVLSYTQALQNLVDSKMPLEHILKAIPLWGDTKTVAKDWQMRIEEIEKKEAAKLLMEKNIDNNASTIQDKKEQAPE